MKMGVFENNLAQLYSKRSVYAPSSQSCCISVLHTHLVLPLRGCRNGQHLVVHVELKHNATTSVLHLNGYVVVVFLAGEHCCLPLICH